MITSFFKPKSQKVKPTLANKPAIPDSGSKRQRDRDGNEEPPKKLKTASPETEKLLSYLDSGDDKNAMTWKGAMQKCFATPSFERLATFVSQQR